VFKWVKKWWRKRLQKIDEATLFPEFRKRAKSEEQYKKAVALHKQLDPAWEGAEDDGADTR